HPRSRSASPNTETRSFIREAADENDFEALKEGLSFALGDSGGVGNWLPVGSDSRSERSASPSNERHSHEITSVPSQDIHQAASEYGNYTDNIPLENLAPYSVRTNSNVSRATSKSLRDESLMVPIITPTRSNPVPNLVVNVSPDKLESGDYLTVQQSHVRDGTASPTKLSSVIARISNRIAGTGAQSASSNASKDDLSKTNRLSVNESASDYPLETPISNKSFFHHDNLSRVSNRVNVETPRMAHSHHFTVDDEDATEDLNKTFVSDGLGLYLSEGQQKEELDITNINPQTPGLIHQWRPPHEAATPLMPQGDTEGKRYSSRNSFKDVKSMYLFGNSLLFFGPDSKTRRYCHGVLSHYTTNVVLLISLLLQVVLLAYRQWNPIKLNGYFYTGYNWADYALIAINIVYTLEVVGKVIAYGFADDHIMFQELGLRYPENDLKAMYFNLTYIKRILSWMGITKLIKREDKSVPLQKPPRENKVKFRDDDNGSSSDDPDIKEIDIGGPIKTNTEDHSNINHLKNKYKELNSHHENDVRTSESDDEDIGLMDAIVLPSQTLEARNTLLLRKSQSIDKLNLKRAYIRNSWHRIDFLSMICFWIATLLSINHYDAKHQIMIFRALSCLRILRLINLTTGTTTILKACKIAIPQLIDVAIFIACFWLFFGIIGVQSFKSSLTRQCVWTNPDDPTETYIQTEQFCGSWLSLDGKAQPYIERDGSLSPEIKGYRCPVNSRCISGDNPYNGTVSFDNIFQSLEMVFVVISANTFTDIMYYTMDSDNMAACLFFIATIFIMTVWLTNVFIAVIVASFNITRMEVAEEKKKSKDGKKSLFSNNEKEALYKEKLQNLKNQNVFLKYYYQFEFVFVILIIVDLFVHCFREYGMTDRRRHTLYRFEAAFTIVFMSEVALRFCFHFPNWRLFFASKRNCFDLLLGVVTCVIISDPVKNKLGHTYYWLTVFQLMRFYRVVLATRFTRDLWLKIMGNAKALFDLTLFFFILLFLVSIILARYFEGGIPPDSIDDVDFPMHTLPNAFISLYIITSTENWTDILYSLQEHATTTSYRAFGAIFLIAWFILSNMIILNIFIAVIAKTLEVSEEGKRRKQLLQFIDNMTDRLQNMETDTGLLTKLKEKVFKTRGMRDELQTAVVNLLLTGTAVNDFVDSEDGQISDNEEIMEVPNSKWKRWVKTRSKGGSNLLMNPFFGRGREKPKFAIDNFDPARFAKSIMTERNLLIHNQNKFLIENPRFNYVFYVMGPRHRLRRFCQRMVKPSHGQRIDGEEPYGPVSETIVVIMFLATIALVVTACYLTPLYRRRMVTLHGLYNWIFWLEVAFNVLFTSEFLIKIFADGLIFTPNGYMRSSWNMIDLSVLLSLWIEFFAFIRNDGNLSRIVRGMKAMRALRLLTISETAKANFHNTLISGFWKIINAALISLCLLFPFSIWGLNIFAGRLGYCLDGTSNMSSCFNEYSNTVFDWDILSPNVYTNPQLEFNRFGTAFSTLFEIVSLEGWVDLLQNVMASTGVGTPPEKNATPINGVFIILFNFTSIIFILTLFVSVIISNYSKTTGRAYLTHDQIAWYQVKKILSQVKPSRRKDAAQLSLFRKFCYKMTVEKNRYWNIILTSVLFLHVLALLLECFPSYYTLNNFRFAIYTITATLFTINIVMKLIAQGRSFIRFKWNIFNMVVSIGAFITSLIGMNIDQDSVFININKLFLVGMLFFIIPRSNRLSQLLRFASASLPALLSLSFTWIVMFLVFAIALNQIFGLTKIGPNGNGNLNFRSVPKAMIVLFRCCFGEGWNYIMEDYTLSSPFCTTANSLDDSDCGNKQYAYILFMAWNILSMYIFLNMFVSLILDSFSYINHRSHYSNLIKRDEIRKFKKSWQKFDPEGTGYIKPFLLPKLLHSLDGALAFHFYSGVLEIPILCNQWFTRNNINDPYDITVHYDAIDQTLDCMDIPKIRERRKAYERFIEEALLNMELNNDPGISFSRLILQLPLYTSFQAGQCLNLIDFLERRLLVQKIEKRLHRKRVYETIAAYACRWKYQKNQRRGVRDTDIAFDKELQRNSYLSNAEYSAHWKSLYSDDEFSLDEAKVHIRDFSDTNQFLKPTTENEGAASGVYVPISNSNQTRNRSRSPSRSVHSDSDRPRLFVHIPKDTSSSLNESTGSERIQISPFLRESDGDQNLSVMEFSDIGEALEESSWGEALHQVSSNERRGHNLED
ncbi:calcium channel protein, partial [Scheffersomyces stipitis CBS 6054]